MPSKSEMRELEKFVNKRKTKKLTKEGKKQIKKLKKPNTKWKGKSYYTLLKPKVLNFVKHYQTDFTKHDRPQLLRFKGEMIFGMRESGTMKQLFNNAFKRKAKTEKKEEAIRSFRYWLGDQKKFFHGKNGKIKEITKVDAIRIFEKNFEKNMPPPPKMPRFNEENAIKKINAIINSRTFYGIRKERPTKKNSTYLIWSNGRKAWIPRGKAVDKEHRLDANEIIVPYPPMVVEKLLKAKKLKDLPLYKNSTEARYGRR